MGSNEGGKDPWLEKDCLHMIGHWEERRGSKDSCVSVCQKIGGAGIVPLSCLGNWLPKEEYHVYGG